MYFFFIKLDDFIFVELVKQDQTRLFITSSVSYSVGLGHEETQIEVECNGQWRLNERLEDLVFTNDIGLVG